MALVDKQVIKVTTVARRIIIVASPIPAWPTTHDNRKNIMTPKIFKRQRIYQKRKVKTKNYSFKFLTINTRTP